MGYFSELNLEMSYEDHSYPTEEQQLMWRIDDLKDRLQELQEKGASYRSGYVYMDEDIKYALPEDLHCIYHVEKALEMAKQDLYNKYGIDLYEQEEQSDEISDTDYVDPRQMTLFDYMYNNESSEELQKKAA